MTDEILPKSAQVICLTDVRALYRIGKCRHRQLLVDQDKMTVECGDCGAELNPVAMLARFAHEETRWKIEFNRIQAALEKLKSKTRCKCEYCGHMTKIKY